MTQKYIPTKWVANETIGTANVMNNIEQGILNAHNKVDQINNNIGEIEEVINNVDNKINTLNEVFQHNHLVPGQQGYYRLPNGLLLQWGVTSNSAYSDTARVYFTIPYTSSFFNIQITGQWAFSNNHFWVLAETDYRTYFDAYKNNSIEVEDNVYWFTIGI